MSDFDPCACITHSALMQRLLQMLRNAQDTCTDSECFEDLQAQNNDGLSWTALLFLWALLAAAFFLTRPKALRSGPDRDCGPGSSSSSSSSSSSNGPPPPPPPPPAGQT
ncbi:hypothetical protein PTSG_11955 [Salpingoeca rosetta]|uniref:Small integral membrane protein 14 n=1 Tax=Salpingoeca rosetta (strain ATCC 50818 / BSB-021) TaxID=946362 RepID=F2U424_SALR5|nr:uncharacterized protein PTSG_11955 [Salpingoeca rosetta]EGD82368.1 hypothetical protein PTSG_11955 [Salpingoeca rosetta]|eukprot:XP_004996551.1 hypothetical protein PTSG_11955 [Salpingoeca rosetta]